MTRYRSRRLLWWPLIASTLLLNGQLWARDAAAPSIDLAAISNWNRTGRYAEAEKASRSILRNSAILDRADSIDTALLLDQLAVALRRGGKADTPEAMDVCERAIEMKRRLFGPDDHAFAASLHNLGLLVYTRGDPKGSLPILESALRIREQDPATPPSDLAFSLNAMGATRAELGEIPAARDLLERAVAIHAAALPPDDPDRGFGLNALASIQYQLGDYAAAGPNFEEVARIWENAGGPSNAMLGAAYHNLGALYSEMGDSENARDLLERARWIRVALFGRDNPLVASTLTVQGDNFRDLGDLDRATACLEEALRIDRKAFGEDHSTVGYESMKLGLLWLARGQTRRAKPLLQRGLQVQESSLGVDHPDLWQALLGLARVAESEGNVSEARALYARNVSLLERNYGAVHPDLGAVLSRQGAFLLSCGDSAAAIEASLRAAMVNGEHLRLAARGLAERQALVHASTTETGLDVALAVLAGEPFRSDSASVRRAWDALTRCRTLVLDEVAARHRAMGADERSKTERSRLVTQRQRLANLLVRGPDGASVERYQALVDDARNGVERAEREQALGNPAVRGEQARGRVGLREVAAALPSGSDLLAYAAYGKGASRAYLAFVLRNDRAVDVLPLGPASEIDRLVALWRSAAAKDPGSRTAGRAEGECRRIGEALRARVWDPIIRRTPATDRLFVVPDGLLLFVNLAALPTGRSQYLVETGPVIQYLSSERDLASVDSSAPHGTGLFALGGPTFGMSSQPAPARGPGGTAPDPDDFRSLRFEPLPESAVEAREIATLWEEQGQAIVLTGAAATERAVKEGASGRRIVHLATHGFVLGVKGESVRREGDANRRGIGGIVPEGAESRRRPARGSPLQLSGLALAGANRRAAAGPGEEDGVLTAEEISSLDLSEVEWAVLSACDTGLGRIQSGEGVLGLRRAFQAAGVHTLIMSLWSVEDRSTREWMHALYEGRLRSGYGTARAVREATLRVLHDRRSGGRSTHPFFWAAFVAEGDWN